jgi:hypothetical protein
MGRPRSLGAESFGGLPAWRAILRRPLQCVFVCKKRGCSTISAYAAAQPPLCEILSWANRDGPLGACVCCMRFARRLRIGLPRDGPFRAGIVFKQEIYPRTQMKSDCLLWPNA